MNHGKDAVQLDLRTRAGREDLRGLVADSDVFLHNWRPGKAAEWQLEPYDLAAVNPRLVYGHASGWGSRADMADVIGTDFLVQAHAGVGAGINPEGTPPVPSRALLADYAGAVVTCEAVLAGLYARQRTDRDQQVETSLLAGAMALQAHVCEAIVAGREKGRRHALGTCRSAPCRTDRRGAHRQVRARAHRRRHRLRRGLHRSRCAAHPTATGAPVPTARGCCVNPPVPLEDGVSGTDPHRYKEELR